MQKRFVFWFALGAFAVGVFCFLEGEDLRGEKEMAGLPEASESDSVQVGGDNAQRDGVVSDVTAILDNGTNADSLPAPEAGAAEPETRAWPDATAEHERFLLEFNSRLTDDPSTEDFLRNRLWVELDPLNGPLARSLALTPDETARLKRLVVDNLVAAANRITPGGEPDATAVEAGLEIALVDGRQDFDTKLVQLLGETRFEAYQAYKEDPLPFNRIKFLKPNEPLPDEQTERVLGVIADERRTVNDAAAKVLTEDGIDPQSAPARDRAQWRLQIQKLIDERVYDRLQTVLSPDRLTTVAEFQERHLQMLDSDMNNAIDAR